MLAVRRGGVDSVRQLVASMFLMETQVIINTINMIIKMRFMMILGMVAKNVPKCGLLYDITLRPPIV